jgi:hypothetical protein
MIDLSPSVTGPWLILGDFNLIRKPCEKNTPRFDCNLAAAFNSMIQSMALFELPLLDRLFTWTNGQDPPILARLDRAFFNHEWNNAFPTSSLTTLPRPTSDHFPSSSPRDPPSRTLPTSVSKMHGLLTLPSSQPPCLPGPLLCLLATPPP